MADTTDIVDGVDPPPAESWDAAGKIRSLHEQLPTSVHEQLKRLRTERDLLQERLDDVIEQFCRFVREEASCAVCGNPACCWVVLVDARNTVLGRSPVCEFCTRKRSDQARAAHLISFVQPFPAAAVPL